MRALLFVRSAWRLLRSLETAAPSPATGTARTRHLQAIQQVQDPICCLTCENFTLVLNVCLVFST